MTMSTLHRLLAALALCAGLAAAPGIARAAQSYDNCTGFIESLPTTISTQGVWCLNKNLSTAITSGAAITIAINNVTIDCNDFKIGGLAAGDESNAYGIYANARQNATVRQCHVRGFREGLRLLGGAGHLIEDNRFDNNLVYGVHVVNGDNSLVQRNQVYDTGGRPIVGFATGIHADADVIDNTVSGVFGVAANVAVTGIHAGSSATVRNNRVRGLQPTGSSTAVGIKLADAGAMVDGNHVIGGGTTSVPGGAITGAGDPVTPDIACSNNVVGGFMGGFFACVDAGGNTRL